MAKKDFWDDSLKDKKLTPRKKMNQARAIKEDTQMVVMDGKFHPTKSTLLKAIVRIIMFIAAMAVALSLYIGYRYYSDRSSGGVVSTTYFDSNGFSKLCDDKIDHLMNLIQAIEKDDSLLAEENESTLKSLAESYLGESGNFSYIIYDGDANLIVSSGEDSISRIESSSHFIKISTKDDQFKVETSVPESNLSKSDWKEELSARSKKYVIYAAVDNALTVEDEFYESYVKFDQITNYYDLAKIIGIVALAIFAVGLVFSCIATGRNKIHAGVKMSLFDGIPTELFIIISLAVLGAIVFAVYYLRQIGFKYNRYALIAGVVLFYVCGIRFLMSLIRRLKSGEFIDNSGIYMIGSKINAGLNRLPKALKVIIIILILVVINGGLIYAQRLFGYITVKGIPVIFAVSLLIFAIEFIIALCCIFCAARKPKAKAGEEAEEAPAHDSQDDSIDADIRRDAFVEPDAGESNFDDGNFGEGVQKAMEGTLPKITVPEEPEVMQAVTNINNPIITNVPDKTVDFSSDEMAVINEAVVNEIIILADLTKEVRKDYRNEFKEKEIGVALRTQATPVCVEMERSDAERLIAVLFESAIKFSARESKLVVEIYAKNGKAIYIMKNNTSPDYADAINTDLVLSLKEARSIVEDCGGKIIPTIEGDKFKIGIIMNAAE